MVVLFGLFVLKVSLDNDLLNCEFSPVLIDITPNQRGVLIPAILSLIVEII